MKIRWAILGTGTIATEFASGFEAANAELVAVASRSKEKAQFFAEKFAIPAYYDDYAELLADDAVDVIYIALPHSHHHQWIKASLEAGKHVLCEKVITINKAQLDELVQLAEAKGLYLAEAMTIYHMPLYRKLKEWIEEHDLGPLKMIQASFGSFKDTDPSVYYFNKELAGGALFDIGTYALSFVRNFMTSKPTEIMTMGNLHESGVDESSAIILRNAEAELATISLTFRAKMPKQGVVAYEKGFFTIMDYPRPTKAVFTSYDGKETIIEAGAFAQGLNYEVADFSELILNGSANETLAYTLDVLEVMDKVRKDWGLVYPFE
ncbi:putative dehydrogenase [Trichococcus patagoniensis]|uniref:Putative dehydrogenase n=1 Tax=Trichococcus patagoniensis TaxID=382641 RepID=A0A2T5ID73_9LACT|nr:Gfo/Idh/MocA family oxidoreductase [Trichococcus patagoniensis]PTQ81775.1 putative dehydrogenase [Trichococcus patagoniensis]